MGFCEVHWTILFGDCVLSRAARDNFDFTDDIVIQILDACGRDGIIRP